MHAAPQERLVQPGGLLGPRYRLLKVGDALLRRERLQLGAHPLQSIGLGDPVAHNVVNATTQVGEHDDGVDRGDDREEDDQRPGQDVPAQPEHRPGWPEPVERR